MIKGTVMTLLCSGMARISVILVAVAGFSQQATNAAWADQPRDSAAASGTSEVIASAKALVLVVGQGPVLVPPSRAVVLQCAPRGGGTHPKPREACALLAGVDGDVQKLRNTNQTACPTIYEPVTVSSVGVWDDHFLLSIRTFGNPCELASTLGPVGSF
ncbi:SSI family serine proteinase inhibitor [Sphaerisporangium sp. NPDC049003]|uniref:SSI family serine proteinase inhibitor n=1 Tax=Sphaerisporangium sp. NPDC049003 TaxID=3364517 RepID=UPI00371424B9